MPSTLEFATCTATEVFTISPAPLAETANRAGVSSPGSTVERLTHSLDELERLARQRYVSSYHRALAHTALGDRDGALGLLTQAFERRDASIINLGVEPRFDALGSDPRYKALVEQLALPD